MGLANTPEDVRTHVKLVEEMLAKARDEYRIRRGHDVAARFEIVS